MNSFFFHPCDCVFLQLCFHDAVVNVLLGSMTGGSWSWVARPRPPPEPSGSSPGSGTQRVQSRPPRFPCCPSSLLPDHNCGPVSTLTGPALGFPGPGRRRASASTPAVKHRRGPSTLTPPAGDTGGIGTNLRWNQDREPQQEAGLQNQSEPGCTVDEDA